ncbi:hypothetical protein PENTCL1PPCAC_21023, partial [Pristionchus entomophagus]
MSCSVISDAMVDFSYVRYNLMDFQNEEAHDLKFDASLYCSLSLIDLILYFAGLAMALVTVMPR